AADPQAVCAGAAECQLNVCDGAGGCAINNEADGTACTDNGQFCDGAETCQAGACTSAGDPCAGGPVCNNTCNEATDTCFSPAATACDDGAFCNGPDTCDGAGACVSAGNPCAAGNACNNTCNEATDTCFSPAATSCDDGAFCNGADTCNGAGACVSAGDPCAGGPVCNNICNEAVDNCISPLGTLCRAPTAGCDPAEQCDGINPVCPADTNGCGETICDDTIDNDSDGAIDCDDSDCYMDPVCLYCLEGDLGDGTGSPVLLDGTTGDPDDYPISTNCGPYATPGEGADVVYLWTPTLSGCYQLDTNGSAHPDPVLRVWSGCDGVELQCDDDSGDAGLDAELLLLATAGTPYFLIIDGYGGSDGDFTLNIQRLGDSTHPFCACPSQDLGGATGTPVASGTNVGFGNTYASSLACGAMSTSAEDVTFTWTAPQDGCYQIDTDGSNYDTILRIFDSCTSWVELECDEDSGSTGLNALIERQFSAGESVNLVVDGDSDLESGNYELNIQRLGDICNESGLCVDGIDNDGDGDTDCADVDCATDPACCPLQSLGGALGTPVASGTNVGSADVFPNTTCGSSGGLDLSFGWTAPLDGCYEISTDNSDYDTVLRIFGSCGGVQQDCDDDGGVGSQSLLTLTLTAGQYLVLVVDGYSSASTGNYDLNIVRLGAACNEIGLCADGIDNDGDG
ncbi:MAG: hypothetical protein ABI333_13665, partial [bacterium]